MISTPIVTTAEALSPYESDGNSSSIDSTTSNDDFNEKKLTESSKQSKEQTVDSYNSDSIVNEDVLSTENTIDPIPSDDFNNSAIEIPFDGPFYALPSLVGPDNRTQPNEPIRDFRSVIELNQNGIPVNGIEHIPDNMIFANTFAGSGSVYLNDVLVSGTRPVRPNSVIRYAGIGIDSNGRTIDGIVIAHGTFQINAAGAIWKDQLAHVVSMGQMTVWIVYQDDDSQVKDPVWINFMMRSGNTSSAPPIYTNYNMLDSQVLALAFDNSLVGARALHWRLRDDLLTVGNNNGVFNLGSPNVNFNAIMKPEPFVIAAGFAAANPVRLFRQEGAVMDIDFSRLAVSGHTIEEEFLSKYTVSQEIPTIASRELNIQIENPDVLMGRDVSILSIEDDSETDLKGQATVEKKDKELMISFSQETVEALREKTITIELEYPIDKTKQVEDYLEGDYLAIDLLATNSRSAVEATGTAQTWARPWGKAIPQEVGLASSTNELDANDFVENLENKLTDDEPFVVDFVEERIFDTLGETSIGVVIESEISGIQNIIDVPVTVVENEGTVFVHHVDTEGNTLADYEELLGIIGEAYETQPQEIKNYHVIETPENATGVYSEEDIDVTYIYDIAPVLPVDPLDPDTETTPENGPMIPDGQGLVSLDFVSQFNFGEVAIHAGAKQYEAQPQRIMNGSDSHERPNYIQVSDRRETDNRGGWSVIATLSAEGFRNEANEELRGASIQLANQELAKPSVNTGRLPQIVRNNGADLLPGVSTRLLDASAAEGQGTWVYRFGDQDTAGSSVKLDVPAGANPKATNYQATINWELSVVPGND